MSKDKNVWVLTRSHNEYDQHGEYFVCVFDSSPTLETLAPILSEQGYIKPSINMGEAISRCEHVRKGGGRIDTEDFWFNLSSVEPISGGE